MAVISIFILDNEAKKIELSAPVNSCFSSSSQEKYIEAMETQLATIRNGSFNRTAKFSKKINDEKHYFYAKTCEDLKGHHKITVIVSDTVMTDSILGLYFNASAKQKNASGLQKIIDNPKTIYKENKENREKLQRNYSLHRFRFSLCCSEETSIEDSDDLNINYQKLGGGVYSISRK